MGRESRKPHFSPTTGLATGIRLANSLRISQDNEKNLRRRPPPWRIVTFAAGSST